MITHLLHCLHILRDSNLLGCTKIFTRFLFSFILTLSTYVDSLKIRNIRPAFSNFGLLGGIFISGLELIFRGKLPYTLSHKVPDHVATHEASKFKVVLIILRIDSRSLNHFSV
jgi:hypothetical protein